MPTQEWLKNEFSYGYESGNILSTNPDAVRAAEEKKCGGVYFNIFAKAVFPYLKPESIVLELGPGKGSWSRAILEFLPQGQLHTIDFQDVVPWLQPGNYQGRLCCHQVQDNSFSAVPDDYFDFFWSFGVLCHQNIEQIKVILKNSFGKMKKGGVAVHQYGDWDKLNQFGWVQGQVPTQFQNLPDDQIWWPRNNQKIMSQAAIDAGWIVIESDLNLIQRDSVIVFKKW